MVRKLLAVLLMTAASTAFAQTITGTITGTVRDSTGALVTGANVNIVNAGTGAARAVQTGGDGNYVAPLLPPGQYRVQVSLQGFKKFEQSCSTSLFSLDKRNNRRLVRVQGC